MAKFLSDIELDALREMMNIGVGYAADRFSRLTGSPVRLSLPEIRLVCDPQEDEDIRALALKNGSMVTQSFRGGFTADAVFLFPGESSLELVRQMLHHETQISEMQELEQDALIEVGNILFNSCISVMSDTIGIPFECGLPQFKAGCLRTAMQDMHIMGDCILLMEIAFTVEDLKVEGYLLFLMKVESVDFFIEAIKKYMGLPT